MKDAQKPDHISLNTLTNRIKEGRYVIPDFQREFEWGPADIRELMRSIFLDYYIGSLLLWKGKPENFDALSCEDIYGYAGDAKPEHIVLDGQQRLTAMHYAFIAPDVSLPSRANRYFYFLRVDRFMAEEYDEAFDYDWRVRRWPAMLTNRERQYREHIFPFAVVGTGGWELGNWVQGYEQFWRDTAVKAKAENDDDEFDRASHHADNAKEFGEHLKGITEQYQVSYVELDRELEVDKVCDIFTQVNSRGVRLDVFDLMNALLKPKGLQLKKMWRKASKKLEFVDSEKMNVYILQVMSILRQAYCSPKYLYFLLPGTEKPRRDPDGTRRKEVLVQDIPDFESRWNEAVSALENSIKLLRHPQEFGAISSNYLPYISILPVFAALQTQAKSLPPHRQLDAQRKVRHWYWSSVFTNRYSGSTDSTSSRDFLDVTAWLDDDEAEPSLLADFQQRFRTIEFRKEIKRGTSVYNGIFNLLVVQGARDWMTGNVPQYGDLDDHHIVPNSWGSKNLKGTLVHTILNRTPLTSDTNRKVIKDRLPNEYLPELIAANDAATVRGILESHFISPLAQQILVRNPFGPDDFEEFITERQRTLQEAIENLLIKERIDLTPQLRELDEKIEVAERNLRNEIARRLEASSNEIPSHVGQKINERIERAAKKNAAFDIDYYNELKGKLEFADLRELQEIIVSKSGWTLFEAAFLNKDTLASKFNQLAELRNGIRHSRTVDEITRKEGEAALIWFDQVSRKTAAP